MRPTERLRELLDEHGVAWTNQVQLDSTEDNATCWCAPKDGYPYDMAGVTEVGGRLWYQGYMTPEQVIAATIPERSGELTCHKDISEGGWWCRYSCCGYKYLSPFESDGIAENYCPNCGAKVVGD